jgi:glycosyltransferase involved in cell wall biosynthesis
VNSRKTALVHDWLVSLGGGEKVLESIFDLYPFPIFTLVQDEKLLFSTKFHQQKIFSSFIQRVPFARKGFRYYLPLFPMAIEQFDLRNYDLILSNSHAVAKGVLTHAGQLHICYCHSPMRYAWDLYHDYVGDVQGIKGKIVKWTLHYLRNWDIGSLNRVDHFLANSQYIARRIQKVYGREAKVLYPPVDTHLFKRSEKKEDFYLTVSRLAPYKRIDLIVDAFSHMPDKRLVVIGEGPEFSKIKSKAGKNVELLGYQENGVVRDYMAKAKAFIFAAEEDFGIVVVEAQAAGTPVIAFGKGGAQETVLEGETGLFFNEQTISSLIEAIHRFEKIEFDLSKISAHAAQFGVERFKREFQQFVEEKWEAFRENYHPSRR